MHTYHLRRRYFLALLATLLFAVAARSQEVYFHVYDSAGKELRWERFRDIQRNQRDIRKHGETERGPLCDFCKRACEKKECDEGVCDKSAGDVGVLLHPAQLSVFYKVTDEGREAYTLYSSDGGDGENGFPAFEWPDPATPSITLAVAWPTEGGHYSTVLLDVPNPALKDGFYETAADGTPFFVFNFVAAQRVLERLEQMLRARGASATNEFGPEYHPSKDFTQKYEKAKSFFAEAKRARNEPDKGKWGARSFDAAVDATLTLLTEYGIQYARSGAANARAAAPAHWGVTFESEAAPGGSAEDLDSVSQLVNGSRDDGWVRLIFRKGAEPEDYMPLIKEAHRRGLRVLGELRDSFEVKGVRRGEWQGYVSKYVDGLSDTKANPRCAAGEAMPAWLNCDVDEWEVGNEVNGEWIVEGDPATVDPDGILGSGEYIHYAADYIKNQKKLKTRVLLTLYWQLGNLENPKFSMFQWLRETFKEGGTPLSGMESLIDDVGISLYPDKAPMGVAFDRVLTTLRTTFNRPGQRIMITELGYWPEHETDPVCQYGHIWRVGAVTWGADRKAARDEARGEVARLYQAAVLGYPYSGGGTYWWYYLQERGTERKRGAVWNSLHSLHQSTKSPPP